MPNYLGHADNYIPANPAVTPTHIVPEWYYLPFYAILRAIPNKLVGVLALFASIVILAFLPWLDTSKVRSARYRPLYRQFFWIFVLVCIGLGWLGSKPAEGGYVDRGAHPDRLLLRRTSWSSCRCSACSRRPSRCRTRSRSRCSQGQQPVGASAPAPEHAAEREETRCTSSPRLAVLGSLRSRSSRRRSRAETPTRRRGRNGRSPARSANSIAAQLQRGFKVYREVCQSLPRPQRCSRSAISPSRAVRASRAAQATAVAAEYKVKDGPNDQGEMFERAGRPGRPFPAAVPERAGARASQWRRRSARPLGDRQGAQLRARLSLVHHRHRSRSTRSTAPTTSSRCCRATSEPPAGIDAAVGAHLQQILPRPRDRDAAAARGRPGRPIPTARRRRSSNMPRTSPRS